MVFPLSLAIFFAAGAVASTSPQSSSATCTQSILNNTIAFFSHGPIAFSYGVASVSVCADRCTKLSTCQAWLYSTSGQECQLYREQSVSHSSNPLFVYGFCEESEEAVSSHIVSLPASSTIPSTSIHVSDFFLASARLAILYKLPLADQRYCSTHNLRPKSSNVMPLLIHTSLIAIITTVINKAIKSGQNSQSVSYFAKRCGASIKS
ncbi:hypothetical protein N7465_008664 [Penicillium sp. CMV-2018d]|nr:hypothetical protein N7465_008664 [Penicillium sp. CMV-2018d]